MRHIGAFLFYILCLWPFSICAQQETKTSSITVTAEPILGGVVLYFNPSSQIKNSIDHYKLLRAPSEHGRVLSTDTAANLEYYHDWYKDYFYEADRGKNYAYRVEGYNHEGDLIALSIPEWTNWRVRRMPSPGIMLTPSAYRQIPFYDSSGVAGTGALLPVNVDVTATYYIGRLYSYNRLNELTNTRRGLFSRIGVMFWQVDAKTILEKEGRFMPQIALGAEGSMMLNNAPAPNVSDSPGITLTTKEKNRTFNGIFLVASKDFGWFNPSLGWMGGESPSKLIYLAEFLTKDSEAKSGIFAGAIFRLGRRLSLQGEFIKPSGAKSSPLLVNLQVGRALHTNFDLAYLKYDRAYEVMAHINFRYTLYPTLGKK